MAAGAEASTTRAQARPTLHGERVLALAAVVVGCTLPAVRVVGLVRDASRMQYNDYWAMLDSLLAPDGSWHWGGALVAQTSTPSSSRSSCTS